MNNLNSKKNILFCANTYLEYKFSARLSEVCSQIGYHLLVVTLKPSILLQLKRKKVDALLIKKSVGLIEVPELEKLERVSDYILSKKEIEQLYFSIFDFVQKLIDDGRIDIIFIWNGKGLTSLPISEVAKKNNASRIYFELANLPGKLFADPVGVNASSSLYNNMDILRKYKSSEESYRVWKYKYLEYRRSNVIIPQADKSFKKNNALYVLDYLLCKAGVIPVSGDYILSRKIIGKLKRNTNLKPFNNNYSSKKYLFLPLQISNDTQLIFNSDINNIQAIQIAANLANQKKLDLLVKPHPAFSDKKEMKGILKLQKELNFIITNNNTFSLISNAYEVVTINSSVGLDSLILNKKVTFLGRSFYGKLEPELLKNYILSYLINIDYFSDKAIDIDELEKVINLGTNH